MDRTTHPTRKTPPTTVAQVAAFELALIDVARPTFERMYAWFRLVRAWAAIRFDDHRGLLPQRMRLSHSGIRASLVRTKTTGVGEKGGGVRISGRRRCLHSGGGLVGRRVGVVERGVA